MFMLPHFFKHYDQSSSALDRVYKALRSKDLADCVIQAMSVLKETDNYMKFTIPEKSTSEAIHHLAKGKEAFRLGDYQMALMIHNKTLMVAPVDSEFMGLAYYSRAELLLKTKQFPACVKDIENCLALNCPDDLAKKLREMKAEARRVPWEEDLFRKKMFTPFSEQFFTLKGDRNPDIPCATSDVEVIIESGKPKVVAAKDIPVGSGDIIYKSSTYFK